MTRPVLHDYWRSSASYRVRIALSLKGIEYDSRQVTFPPQLAGHPAGAVNRILHEQLVEPRPAV